MLSLSHWGMFEVAPRVMLLPAGYRLVDYDIAEWTRPDGVIQLVRL